MFQVLIHLSDAFQADEREGAEESWPCDVITTAVKDVAAAGDLEVGFSIALAICYHSLPPFFVCFLPVFILRYIATSSIPMINGLCYFRDQSSPLHTSHRFFSHILPRHFCSSHMIY